MLGALLVGLLAAGAATSRAAASTTAPGFTDSVVYSGATQPTVARFDRHGGAYVAEKSGRIVYFKSFGAAPRLVGDVSTEVYDAGDHGLLGMALDPQFPTKPYIYVLYSFDAPIGGTAPRWGTPGVLQDVC